MSYIYSPVTNSFYPMHLKENYQKAGSWPKDGVEISNEDYSTLLKGQASGKLIDTGENGYPVLIDPPAPSHAQLVQEAELQKVALMQDAAAAIAPLQDALDLDILSDEEMEKLTAWKKYRVLLMRVDTSTAPGIEWPTPPVILAS